MGLDDVPPHLREQWELATQELGEASKVLNEACVRYHEAILARIALSKELRNEN